MSSRPVIAVFARAFLLLASALGACNSEPNPCPAGTRPHYDLNRCVAAIDPSVGSTTDGGATVRDAAVDASQGQDALGDAGPSDTNDMDAQAPLGEPDAGTADAGTADAGTADAGVDAGSEDAGTMQDAQSPGICSQADRDAWHDFHLASGLVQTVTTCGAQGCVLGACPAATCTREAAQLQACDTCVEAEATCLLQRCGSACSDASTDPECRACVCEADCVQAFETCAQTSLSACENVHGRDSTNEERVLSGPIVFRQKSATGALSSAALVAAPSKPKLGFSFTQRQSIGWTKILAWSQGLTDYLLQYKGACSTPPCLVRISPVLSNGSLGRPALETRWPAGFTELEVIALEGRVFLALYAPTLALDGAAPGVLRVLEVIERSGSIELAKRLETSMRSSGNAWSLVETVMVADVPHLLLYDAATGEVQVHKLTVSADAVSLSDGGQWQSEAGWTAIEAFSHGLVPYLLTYEAVAGATRIVSLLDTDGKVGLGTALFQGTWPKAVTGVHTFHIAGETFLLRHTQTTGSVDVTRLASDANGWSTSLGTASYVDAWGKTPPWDLVAIAHAGNR